LRIHGKPTRTLWLAPDGWGVEIIDQTQLPHVLAVRRLETLDDAEQAIRDMWVRGAPLIGVTAAFGLALAMRQDPSDGYLGEACRRLLATRPTAVNLRWALEDLQALLRPASPAERASAAYGRAVALADEDVAINAAIGTQGLALLRTLWAERQANGAKRLNILTHCNAGWLATVDWGTALAPIYKADEAGIPLHIWVDETRPRNQGASLTACELGWQGIAHTVVVDNAGGHLMQHGLVDLCIVGTDRTTAQGDVCNKIGTYLKALAAKDNNVPFYVGLPGPTIDWTIEDGIASIPIEERDPREVTEVIGRSANGQQMAVQITPDGTAAANYGFDVTPARLITGLITERGICSASKAGLQSLYPRR